MIEPGPMYGPRIEAVERVLRECNGRDSRAALWAFSISHAELMLRLTASSGVERTLRLSGCTRIAAPVRWSNVDLHLEMSADRPGQCELFDRTAAVSIDVGVIFVDGEPDPWTGEAG